METEEKKEGSPESENMAQPDLNAETTTEEKKETEKPKFEIVPVYRKLIDCTMYKADGKTPIYCHVVPGFLQRIGKQNHYIRVATCNLDCDALEFCMPTADELKEAENISKETGKKVDLPNYVIKHCIKYRYPVEVIVTQQKANEKKQGEKK